MDFVSVLSAVLTLIAGIGVFLVACKMMSSNLESMSGNSLRTLFSKTSENKLIGVGIGTVGTAAIQSSGAMTVMVIGFVNAGIMTISQAATITYGANIGTTITGQIVALGLFGGNTISTTVIFSALSGVGALFMMFAKKDSVKRIGGILAGFGMLFVGLSMMSGSMSEFAKLESVKTFLASISSGAVLILVGALLTAVVQSSSVMTSIAITMVVSGLITLDQGIYITVGSNIGACIVAILAGFSAGQKAKRVSIIHLMVNVYGAVIFWVIEVLLSLFGDLSVATLFEKMFQGAPHTQLAMFHTFFNVIKMLAALPLTKFFVRITTKMFPDKDADENKTFIPTLHFLDDNMLRTPVIAVHQTKNEIVNMAKIAYENFAIACDIICTMDYSRIEEFRNNEIELDYINKELVGKIVRLSGMEMNEADHIYLSSTFRTIADLERIGDYAENIVEYADSLKDHSDRFSEQAKAEIIAVRDLVHDLYSNAMTVYMTGDEKSYEDAEMIENMIDDVASEMEEGHIERLEKGICTPNVGAQYLSLAANAERIGDHFMNVAKVNAKKQMSNI